MGLLDNKVVLITGGAQGMGASHVRCCHAEGASVVFGDIQTQAGEALQAELGERVRFVKQDVTSEADWAALAATAEEAFGGIDVLVNNAGMHIHRPVEEEDAATLRKLYEVNVVSAFTGLRTVLPSMRRRGGGSIINISSLAGLRGIPGYSAYGASKWALRGLTQIWAQELGPDQIRVNAIMPGGIAGTSMFSSDQDPEMLAQMEASIPMRRAGQPDDVSGTVVFLASELSKYMTGTEQIVDGGRVLW